MFYRTLLGSRGRGGEGIGAGAGTGSGSLAGGRLVVDGRLVGSGCAMDLFVGFVGARRNGASPGGSAVGARSGIVSGVVGTAVSPVD
jgi:hypothetical protein